MDVKKWYEEPLADGKQVIKCDRPIWAKYAGDMNVTLTWRVGDRWSSTRFAVGTEQQGDKKVAKVVAIAMDDEEGINKLHEMLMNPINLAQHKVLTDERYNEKKKTVLVITYIN